MQEKLKAISWGIIPLLMNVLFNIFFLLHFKWFDLFNQWYSIRYDEDGNNFFALLQILTVTIYKQYYIPIAVVLLVIISIISVCLMLKYKSLTKMLVPVLFIYILANVSIPGLICFGINLF